MATCRAANTFAVLLIIEMLMNCIFNQINGAFHNYLSLYIGDNDNNTTFVGSYCLFVALVVTFANVTTRATNKQYALQKPCYSVPYWYQYLKLTFLMKKNTQLK